MALRFQHPANDSLKKQSVGAAHSNIAFVARGIRAKLSNNLKWFLGCLPLPHTSVIYEGFLSENELIADTP